MATVHLRFYLEGVSSPPDAAFSGRCPDQRPPALAGCNAPGVRFMEPVPTPGRFPEWLSCFPRHTAFRRNAGS